MVAEIRPEVWKFLLNVYDWSSTTADREKGAKEKKDAYYRIKLQWKTIFEDQENRFTDFRDRKALIGPEFFKFPVFFCVQISKGF